MAHGIIYNSRFKHDQIIDFRAVRLITKKQLEAYKSNYAFVWDIYNTVARDNGIVLPKTWVAVEAKSRRDRYRTLKQDMWILEPLGPTVPVDIYYDINSHRYGSMERGAVLYHVNWYDWAERFFMVRHSAKKTLSNQTNHRHGFMCESWRAKSMDLTYRKTSNKLDAK